MLRRLSPDSIYVEINPLDAAARGIHSGQKIQVASRRATITASALVTASVQQGQLFIPMHFPETNQLTLQVVDPHSRQPSYKYCAVQIISGQ